MEYKNNDYSRLRGRIVEKCRTLGSFAGRIGISDVTLTRKLTNRVDWTQSEIGRTCEVLEIPNSEIGAYFFNGAVLK